MSLPRQGVAGSSLLAMRSPVAYLTDEQFAALPLPERALHVARSQVGVREVPAGSNWGPAVALYLRAAGLVRPAAWCAAFAVWCLVAAGANKRSMWTLGLASTWFLWSWARKRGRLESYPKRGDLFVWSGKGGGHCGFVAEATQTGNRVRLRTIEGNTNAGGSREGVAVLERVRYLDSISDHERWGFVDLGGLDK